jgi:hypothetical protein
MVCCECMVVKWDSLAHKHWISLSWACLYCLNFTFLIFRASFRRHFTCFWYFTTFYSSVFACRWEGISIYTLYWSKGENGISSEVNFYLHSTYRNVRSVCVKRRCYKQCVFFSVVNGCLSHFIFWNERFCDRVTLLMIPLHCVSDVAVSKRRCGRCMHFTGRVYRFLEPEAWFCHTSHNILFVISVKLFVLQAFPLSAIAQMFM